MRPIDVVLDGEATFGVEAQEGANQGAGRVVQVAAGAGHGSGGGGSRLGKVVFVWRRMRSICCSIAAASS